MIASHRTTPTKRRAGKAVLGMRFLNFDEPDAGTHICLENPRQELPFWMHEERRAGGGTGSDFYLPCRLQHKTIAIIGLGRTTHGDLLTSEDVKLLESISELHRDQPCRNAHLDGNLEQKISENCRAAERVQRKHR